MKKLSGIILSLVLAAMFSGQVLAQSATPAAADEKAGKQATTNTQPGSRFVDANHDGICDHQAACQDKGTKGANFTDANGDGKCDHRADGNCGNCQQNCGQGKGHQCGNKTCNTPHPGCGGPCGGQKAPDKK